MPPKITGNSTLTGNNGIQTQLKPGNLNKIGPGMTVDTSPKSFIRTPIPNAANSNSIIGQSSRVSWLDPTAKTMIPWLKFPASFQNFDPSSMLRLDFGKLLVNCMTPSAGQGALIILPASLIGVGASATMSRVLARVKGKHVLFEATPDGTSAAITVLEGESGNETGVGLWRTDDLTHVIEVGATLCPECNAPISKEPTGTSKQTKVVAVVRNKHPWLAAILSFLIPGLGQWYHRKWKLGAAWFLGSILLFILPAFTFYELGFEPTGPTELVLFLAFVVRGASAWDAKRI